MGRALRSLRVLAVVGMLALAACGSGGFLPGSVHAMPQAQLSMLVAEASQQYHVRPELVQAVIDAESHGDPSAVSRAGAQGLMQLMPATSEQYGVFNPFDPHANVDG